MLRKKSADKLKVTYQKDFTEKIVGRQWREEIGDAVREANWFILLLPNPGDDLDWCLYETGLFEAQRSSADRLICLHHPDTKIPSPIEDYHAVAATVPEVEKFLRMILVNNNPVPGMEPINKSIESEIPTFAKEIVDAIRAPIKIVRETYEPWVELKIDSPEALQHRDDIDQATIIEANQGALDIFNLLVKKPKWGEFRADLLEPAGDSRWREELFQAIRMIAQGRKFFPVQAVFNTRDGRIFRPVVCAVDRDGKGGPIEAFHITFAEEVSAIDTTAMPQNMSVLATLLRFTFRFRWEVLERFAKGAITEDDIGRLDNALWRIRVDWESRGIGGPDDIIALFPKEKKQLVKDMLTEWATVNNEDGTGELDKAIKDKNMEKIPVILKRFLPMNQKFLELVTARFSELVSGKS